MKKTILVVGANSTLAKAAMPVLAEGNTIISAGRHGCEVYVDLAKEITIPDGVDVIVNFAASFGGDKDEEIVEAINTNILGMARLCMAAKDRAKHIINISTIFALFDETSPGYSSYSITKKQGDETALFYCKQHNIPLAILRPSRIYGDNKDFAKHQPFLYRIIDNVSAGKDVSLFGAHDASRNYLHVADFGRIVAEVIKRQLEGIYTCPYPSNITYSEIVNTAQRLFNKGGELHFIKDKPAIQDDTFPLSTTLYEKIGFRPDISMEQGIMRMIEQGKGDMT